MSNVFIFKLVLTIFQLSNVQSNLFSRGNSIMSCKTAHFTMSDKRPYYFFYKTSYVNYVAMRFSNLDGKNMQTFKR